MKQADIFFLRGQGGAATSGGIDQMATETARMEHVRSVQTFDWNDWQKVVAAINKHAKDDVVRLACGYSMGSNSLTWILGGVNFQQQHAVGIQGCVFDLAIFIDPTTLSVLTPLSMRTLRKCIHYKNSSLDVVGHADLPLGDFGTTNITIIQTHEPHLMLDFNPVIQHQILSAFKDKIGK